MKRSAALLVSILISGLMWASTPTVSAALTPEADLIARINEFRAGGGVPDLALDPGLSAVAQSWAETMARNGAGSHNPALSQVVPPGWRAIGENVGWGGDIAAIDNFLRNSPVHAANMLNAQFNRIGIGVVNAGGKLWVVEDFGAY
ncbi:CAP domain-containing protein [Antrihabitans sp. YC2-6]|uniref:CAP domain-containing protein n=1 Tax=Antrihabitans sp. YC2-6 TaxID=2799498 RepID=UPI0018F4DFAE|nr:CAP domain-containing protein [Antrihabitans sp. YC2-6]MBJ8346291.1 CAP domain-containing protein [Antrihabitans sp. YC2-6]